MYIIRSIYDTAFLDEGVSWIFTLYSYPTILDPVILKHQHFQFTAKS